MASNLGLPELLIIVFICAVIIWPFWRICQKTGNSGALSLGMLVPLVNIVVLLYLALSEWPIERELRQLKDSTTV